MRREKRGFTLMEMLTVVAVLAVAAAIVVPSVLWLRDAFRMRERNDHARTVYLAAQSRLTALRAGGGLDAFSACPRAAAGAPAGAVYIHSGDGAFDRLLPETVLEEALRAGQMIVEFSPVTGHVYSVFYYEGELDIAEIYAAGQLPREAKPRREILLGYWDGSGLDQARLGYHRVRAEIAYEDGQAGILRVAVPTQVTDAGNLTDLASGGVTRFMESLEITLTLTGQRGGSHRFLLKSRGSAAGCSLGSTEGGVSAVVATYVLDSLRAGWDYAGILPGDNVSILAEVTCDLGAEGPQVVDSAALAGVNPMFGSLTENPDGGWLLTVSNGRHLQNLNSLSHTIAGQIQTVLFTGPEGTVGKGEGVVIDWRETADYYDGLTFTPIAQEALLGSLTDPTGTDRADILGNGAVIRNLTIETEAEYVGLFTVVNTCVDGLTLENPQITAGEESTAGSLAGAVGENGILTGCGSFAGSPEADSGVQGGKTAGGLVGSVSGKLSRCFAAVPVSGDRAGGLVGYGEGTGFSVCYASGLVQGSSAAGGFIGVASDCDFFDCFASGGASGAGAVGGFVGRMEAWSDTRLESCYSLGLSRRNGEVYENFCGENGTITENDTVISDFYRALAPAVLENGKPPKDHRFRDCYYLAGNHPGAAYDNGDSGLWANPVDYETLQTIHSAGKTLLSRLQSSPFDSPEALEHAKKFLQGLGVPPEVTDAYAGCGSYQIYWDAAARLLGAGTLEKQYLAQYAAAFSKGIWDSEGENLFPTLLGLPYYGSFPKRTEAADYGVLYYERRENGLSFHRVSLRDGKETAATAAGQVLEAGYGLYFRAGTLPFGKETWAYAGAEIPDLAQAVGLPKGYALRVLEPEEQKLTVTGRYSGRSVAVVPWFADTLGQGEGPFRIRTQSQLENIARLPDGAFLLEGTVTLDQTFAQIPELRGSLTGASGSKVVFSGGHTGLIGTLAGGTLENIHLSGELTLSGTAGALADRVREGKIRDCGLDVTLSVTDGEAVGPVAGVLESGAIVRTQSLGTVSGSGTHLGSFLGEALGGTLRSCRGQGLPFLGYGAVTGESTISGATHCGPSRLDSEVVSEAALTALTTPPMAPNYAVSIVDCTAFQNGQEADVLETVCYYRLTALGGWKLEKCDTADQFAPTPMDLAAVWESADADWAETEHFLFFGEKFTRLLVKQAGGGLVFGVSSENTVTESERVTAREGLLSEIDFGATAYPVYGAAEAPASGRYLLVTAAGRILCMQAGMLLPAGQLGETDLSDNLFWQAGSESWINEGGSVTVARQGSNAYDGASLAVTVTYTETAAATVTQFDGNGNPQPIPWQETYQRAAECYLYELRENTDCRAEYLGQSRVLRQN